MPFVIPLTRFEILKEIKDINKSIKQSRNYRQIGFLKLHRRYLQKALEKLII